MQKTIPLKFKTVGDYEYTPTYAKKGDACFDLRSRLELTISPKECVIIPLGICMEIPHNYEVQLRPRSGLSLKTGMIAKNTIGTIDAGYRGELGFVAMNLSDKPIAIKVGDRVCQAAIKPVYTAEFIKVDNLSESSRGTGGFNSTGLQ